MKNLKTYSKEKFYNRILEKLKVSKDSNDPILDIVPEEWYGQYGRICLHFSNISSLLMYSLEMEGQLSDGKYENSSPRGHWEWTRLSFFTVDGNEFYTGSSRFRRHNKKYNLNEWVRTINKILTGSDYNFDWAFTIRLYDYARIGKCITKNELKGLIVLNTAGLVNKIYINDYIGTIAEAFGSVLRKNPECTYEEMKQGLRHYEQKAFTELPQFDTEEFFERFKNTKYTFNEFKADYDSMCRTINTPNYE
jgi:hypothetical protein